MRLHCITVLYTYTYVHVHGLMLCTNYVCILHKNEVILKACTTHALVHVHDVLHVHVHVCTNSSPINSDFIHVTKNIINEFVYRIAGNFHGFKNFMD